MRGISVILCIIEYESCVFIIPNLDAKPVDNLNAEEDRRILNYQTVNEKQGGRIY